MAQYREITISDETVSDLRIYDEEGDMIAEQNPKAKADIICRQNSRNGQKWISVKDALPENEGQVLAVYHFKNNAGLRFIGTLSYFSFDPHPHWQHESIGLVVTHWMPLPEPPREDNNG